MMILIAFIMSFSYASFAYGSEDIVVDQENYNVAVQQENDRVAAENKKLDEAETKRVEEAKQHNQEEKAKVEQVEQYNKEEQDRVDNINNQLKEEYEKDLNTYNSKQEDSVENTIVYDENGIAYDENGKPVLKQIHQNNDLVTYENISETNKVKWNNTYDYSGKDNKRYVNFSLIKVIGLATTGTNWDNDASKYNDKVFGTITTERDLTEAPLNVNDPGEGRNLINYKTIQDGIEIGLDVCDSLIRNMTNVPISNYFNAANGSEQSGKKKVFISFLDFPTNATVFKALQENGSVFTDPDTGEVYSGKDINSDNFDIRWFSVKFQSNGWRVSGILMKKGVMTPPEEPVYEEAKLLDEYIPDYWDETWHTPDYIAARNIVIAAKAEEEDLSKQDNNNSTSATTSVSSTRTSISIPTSRQERCTGTC